jgi:putative spermidine/putrescine transport system ATP-binding protein
MGTNIESDSQDEVGPRTTCAPQHEGRPVEIIGFPASRLRYSCCAVLQPAAITPSSSPQREGRGHDLRLDGITHRFGDFAAIDKITLDVHAGELLALLGPSGCGKSTLLRVVSGFIRQSQGSVLFDGERVDHLPPNRRGVGIVFQNYALFPHMSVRRNVAYGLEAHHWPRQRIVPRVEETLDLVHMRALADRLPRQLSGGQQQRIALARCLAIDPKILMLDEPFGALDKNLRLDMQIEVKRLQRQYGITTILVTHDQEEALSMADRIAVMNRGRIEQVASPTDIYDCPATLFVNQFVGTTNLLLGQVVASDASGTEVALAGGVLRAAPAMLAKGTNVMLCVRPEQLRLHSGAGSGQLAGTVKMVMPLGPQVIYDVETADGIAVKISQSRDAAAIAYSSGSTIHFAPVSAASCHIFPQDQWRGP